MDYDVAFKLEKKMIAETSRWFHCETYAKIIRLIYYLLIYYLFDNLEKWLMSFSHSVFNCMRLLLIICSKSAKVMSKQCSGAILISIFSDKGFQSCSFNWKKDFLKFFFNLHKALF